MKIIVTALSLSLLCFPQAKAQTTQGFHVTKTFHIASSGGWDYPALHGDKLYLSHGSQVNVLDKNNGDSLGVIENTTSVHGITFVNSLNRGYTSNGRSNNVTVFDLNTQKQLAQVATGQNPDAIFYDNFSKKVITCNGRSNDLSVIDPQTNKVVSTIPVGGKPETAVSDDAGKIYVDIEDKNEIVEINAKTFKVINHWPVGPGEEPAALSIDRKTKRLFAGCGNKLLIVLDATSGKVVSKVPIGDGCDGDAFDPSTKNIFTSNGLGTVTVIHEDDANTFKVVENAVTKSGARTIALDEKTHTVYLPTAEFEPLPAGAAKNERPKMVPGTFQVLVLQK